MEPVIDECSTLPDGLKIKVMPSGKVHVLAEDTDEKVFYPTVEDEWQKHDDLKPTMTKEKLVKKMLNQRETKRRRVVRKKSKSASAKKVKISNLDFY